MTELMLLVNQEFQISYNANGVHAFKFYTYKGKIITFSDYSIFKKYEPLKCSSYIHVGVKQQLTNDLWIFALFTSNTSTFLNELITMQNIYLNNNNMHYYVNQALITSNEILSSYYTVSNNIYHFPNYCNKINTDHKKLILDSVEGYKEAILASDFNRPISVIDTILEQYLDINARASVKFTKPNAILTYSQKVEYLRFWGLKSSDIIDFTNNFEKNKNIHNQSFYKSDLFYEKSTRRF